MRTVLTVSLVGNVVLAVAAVAFAWIAKRMQNDMVRRDKERWGISD